MKHRIALALCAVLAAVFLGACATQTEVTRLDKKHFIVCDAGQPWQIGDSCDNANPEKGLNDTCPSAGRSIAAYREIENSALLVTCGEKLK